MNLSKLQAMVRDREAWRAAVHGVTELDTTGQLNYSSSSIFNFLRNLHTVCHNGHTNLHSCIQCLGVPISPHPSPTVFISCLFHDSLLTCMRCYLTVVLVCISMIISDIKHLFTNLLAMCMSSLGKHIYSDLPPIF